jgi:mono/diheme cytochrome c family protein
VHRSMTLYAWGLAVVAATSAAQVPESGVTSRDLGIRLAAPGSRAALVERGDAVFAYWCRPCHGPELLKPGTAALAAKYQGALPASLAERTDMTVDFVKFYVRTGISMMPFFRPTEISNADLDALAAYLTRNAGGR